MNISISRIRTWQQCHLKYWFEYEAKIPRRTDYPRLCGIAVHRTAQILYDPQAEPKKGKSARPFYFTSMRAAAGSSSLPLTAHSTKTSSSLPREVLSKGLKQNILRRPWGPSANGATISRLAAAYFRSLSQKVRSRATSKTRSANLRLALSAPGSVSSRSSSASRERNETSRLARCQR